MADQRRAFRANFTLLQKSNALSDFLKKMKGLFVEEVPASQSEPNRRSGNRKPAGPPAANRPPAPPPPPAEGAMVSESQTGKPGKVTDKFTNVLLGAMEKANLDGFDYLEYKQSLQSLKAMNLDEATRYRSAFAMAQTMGVDLPRLVQTAGHYVKVLQQEEQKFEQALANQQAQRIGERKQQAISLEKLAQEKQAQIEKLQREIAEHRAQAEKVSKEVNAAQAKVESTKNNFIASYNNLVRQIQNDVERMKEYLK